MESNISMISIKSLPADGNVYHNEAFSSGEHCKKNDINLANGDKVEQAPIKRNSSSVEFTLPAKTESRDRLPSQATQPYRSDRLPSQATQPYRGMGKEELLRFSSRPLWRNLRYICICIVLTGWLALLITVVALILTYPSCRKAQERDWWQKAVIYRIYVRSFYDSRADGIGDINGIIHKLDYLEQLGVNTISLSPIYKLANNSLTDTHIVNHTDIDHIFGTLQDFKNLVNETHHRGMHITVDFIPNHTSDEHPWFLASKNNSDALQNEYRTFYVWASGRGSNGFQPPNNWKTKDNCSSAWTIATDNLFYLHQLMNTQPELNLRSDKVRDALKDILQFWLDLGVDGFFIRDADYLFEDYDLRDNNFIGNDSECNIEAGHNVDRNRRYTKGLSEVFDMLSRWRAFLDDYGNKTNNYKILFADVDSSYSHVMKYYGLFNRDGVDFPLNRFSLDINITSGGAGVQAMVSNWMNHMPKNYWPNWMGGDDRSERLVERLEEAAGLYLMLSLLLPGTPFFYYGDEIGLQATHSNLTHTHEYLALPMRGPMQWNNTTSAGFCAQLCTSTWMPLNPEYKRQMNVETQMSKPESLFNLFHNLTQLRTDNPSFMYGDYTPVLHDEEVFSFVREYDGQTGYLVILNFANYTVKKDYRGIHGSIPGSAKVEIVSGMGSHHSRGEDTGLANIALVAFEGLVVSWDYKAKEL